MPFSTPQKTSFSHEWPRGLARKTLLCVVSDPRSQDVVSSEFFYSAEISVRICYRCFYVGGFKLVLSFP